MPHEPPLTEALRRLDAMDCPVTDWEAQFLESALRQRRLSLKQQAVVARMCEQYLPEGSALAAEILGQQNLFS